MKKKKSETLLDGGGKEGGCTEDWEKRVREKKKWSI